MALVATKFFDLEHYTFTYEGLEKKMSKLAYIHGQGLTCIRGPDDPLHPKWARDGLIKTDDSNPIIGYGECRSAVNYYYQGKAIVMESPEKIKQIRRSRDPFEASWVDEDMWLEHIDEWESLKIHTAFVANWLKFTQNDGLSTLLLETGSRYISCCQRPPWGDFNQGPQYDDERRVNITGKILMVIREQLRRLKKSSFEWNTAPLDVPDLYSKPGTPCNNYNGYCDIFQQCREVDPSGPLATLRRFLLSNESMASIKRWLNEQWICVIILCIMALLIVFLLIKVFEKRNYELPKSELFESNCLDVTSSSNTSSSSVFTRHRHNSSSSTSSSRPAMVRNHGNLVRTSLAFGHQLNYHNDTHEFHCHPLGLSGNGWV